MVRRFRLLVGCNHWSMNLVFVEISKAVFHYLHHLDLVLLVEAAEWVESNIDALRLTYGCYLNDSLQEIALVAMR